MKNRILYLIAGLAAAVAVYACHEPEKPYSNTANAGLNSFSAMFAYGDYKDNLAAVFTTLVDPTKEEILIEIPWFYPIDSDNETSITQMRVMANIDANCYINPHMGGVRDLNEKHYFTFTNKNGVKTQHYVTGVIRKLPLKSIIDFSLDSHGISGVIDEETLTITLVTAEEVTNATAAVTISPHASISPDPTVARSYETPVQFTVTAHDGSQNVYTVQKGIPDKIPSGFRQGSQKELWSINLAALGIAPMSGANFSLAAIGNNLVFNLGDGQIYFNVVTGQRVGNIAGSMDIGNGSITSDKAGHLILCNEAAPGNTLTVYGTNSVNTAPVQLFTYPNNTGANIGKRISVQGDITGDAIVTMPIYSWAGTLSSFVRVAVAGGVAGAPELVTMSGAGSWNGNGNADMVYMTADPTDGYFTASYSDCHLRFMDNSTNAPRYSYIGSWGGGNQNLNTVDAITFNNARYAAIGIGRHFSYSAGCWPYLFDVTTFDNFTSGQAVVFAPQPTSFAGNGIYAYTDVILWTSDDGFKMRMFYVDSNSQTLIAYEFDCIDR